MKFGKKSDPLSGVFLILSGSLLLACLLAPVAFNGLISLGRNVQLFEFFREVEFHRIFSRTAMVLGVVAIYFCAKLANMRGLSELGFPKSANKLKSGLFAGIVLGFGSLVPLMGLGVLSGAYSPVVGRDWLPQLGLSLVAGLLVGFLEEGFFRGLLYGVGRKSGGKFVATIWTSVFYAFIHLIKPNPNTGEVIGTFRSGFDLVGSAFTNPGWAGYVPSFFTLFLIGVLFCLLYEKTGNLYSAVGLHASWVFLAQMLPVLCDRNPDILPLVFGSGTAIIKSYAALVMAFGLVLLVAGRKVQKSVMGSAAA